MFTGQLFVLFMNGLSISFSHFSTGCDHLQQFLGLLYIILDAFFLLHVLQIFPQPVLCILILFEIFLHVENLYFDTVKFTNFPFCFHV